MSRFLYLSSLIISSTIHAFAQPSTFVDKNKEANDEYSEKYLPNLLHNIDTSVKAVNWKSAAAWSNHVATVYYRQFRYEESEKYTLQSISFAQKAGDITKQVVEYNNLGYNRYKRYDYPIATEYFLKGLRLAQEANYKVLEININIGIASIYKYLEDYSRALNYYTSAYNATQQYVKGDSAQRLLSNLYMNMGNCEDRMGNHRSGIFYYQKYLALAPQSRYVQVLAYNNIGTSLFKLNEVDSAEMFFKKAYAVEDTINNPPGRSYSYHSFALVAYEKKEYKKAIDFAVRSISGAKRYRVKNLEWLCNKVLADCYQQTGDYRLANENLAVYAAMRDSIFLRQRIDRVGVLDAAYRFELETGKQQQQIALLNKENTVKALELSNLQTQNELDQLQLSNLNKEKALAQLQLSNMTKEKALAALQLNNLRQKDSLNRLTLKNINQANAETNIRLQNLHQQVRLNKLQLSLERRNKLLMGAGIGILLLGFLLFYRLYRHRKLLELERIRSGIAADFHDDLGSTLSSIALHSEIALRSVETAPAHMQKTLTQISEASRSTVSAMQDMIWSIQPQHDTMKQTVLRMQEWAFPLAEAKNIDLHFQVEEGVKNLRLSMELRKNIYLIFKEALNNAFKYACATQMNMDLSRAGQWLLLQVTDNGKGFDTNALATKGNGLRNMHKRAAQGGGQLQITSAPGVGTKLEYKCFVEKM